MSDFFFLKEGLWVKPGNNQDCFEDSYVNFGRKLVCVTESRMEHENTVYVLV